MKVKSVTYEKNWAGKFYRQRFLPTMTQPMPTHAHQTELLTSRLELLVNQIVPLKRSARTRRKYQSLGIRPRPLSGGKNLDGLRPQGHRTFATRSLRFI